MQPRSRSFSVSVTKVARHAESAGDRPSRLSAGARLAARPRRHADRAHTGRKQTLAISLPEPRRGRVFKRESAVADDARGVGADVRRCRQMQAGRPHIVLGCDLERRLEGQEAASAPPVERGGVERLDAPGGVGIDRLGAALVEKMRQVGGDRDDRLRSAPDPAQRLGDSMGIGVADQHGDDFERRRQHRLEHYQMHFERMLAHERPRVDDNSGRLCEPGVRDGRDRSLAERRAPFRRRMDRNAGKRDAMGGADDHDAARWLDAARPGAERGRRDRA